MALIYYFDRRTICKFHDNHDDVMGAAAPGPTFLVGPEFVGSGKICFNFDSINTLISSCLKGHNY